VRVKPSDIIRRNERESLSKAWDASKPAEEFGPLPTGVYVAHIIGGELAKAGTGAPGYKLTFRVAEGDYAGRRFWHDLWLTPGAMPLAKRDLLKLGVTSLEQLDSPLPRGIRCRVKLALHTDDNGRQYNRARSFEVIGRDAPEQGPFAPQEAGVGGSGQGEQPTPQEGASAEGGEA
jgi:hypothetical protein